MAGQFLLSKGPNTVSFYHAHLPLLSNVPWKSVWQWITVTCTPPARVIMMVVIKNNNMRMKVVMMMMMMMMISIGDTYCFGLLKPPFPPFFCNYTSFSFRNCCLPLQMVLVNVSITQFNTLTHTCVCVYMYICIYIHLRDGFSNVQVTQARPTWVLRTCALVNVPSKTL